MSINKVFLTGNLTKDPELNETATGKAVLNFKIAVNERRKNQAGEWEDFPNYVECTMYGNYGRTLSRYLSKGSKVSLEGRLRYSSWEKNGEFRSKLQVIVDELELPPKAKPVPEIPEYEPVPYTDEDVPF